jgi:crotonobetainyl-CoA:carnitine CoA-transferase CaiB-like acyl-CoA transferase
MFLVMNRNKRAMTLDPTSADGREVVRKLVATADVVVANLPPEVLRGLALDLESLRRVKPNIILTTVTAFGAGGPWSHKHGFDGIGQLMCGSAYLTGTPAQPLRAAVAWVDCARRLSRHSARWPRSWHERRRAAARRSKARCCVPPSRTTTPRWSNSK